MPHLTYPIAHLENHDFDQRGRLVNSDIPDDIPVVIMVQASWCGHCKSAKPAFQEFADIHAPHHVFAATIQADGERESEQVLSNRLTELKPSFQGFPDYLLYKNGVRVAKNVSGRTVADLEAFVGLS